MTSENTSPIKDGDGLDELARKFGLEVMREPPPDALDPALVADLPVEWARANLMLPIRRGGETLALTPDPADTNRLKHLELLLGAELRPVLAPPETVLKAIEQCYYSRANSASQFIRDMPAGRAAAAAGTSRSEDLLEEARNAPVRQLINLALLEALKARASDVHFEPLEASMRIRYRVDGLLYEQASPPKHMQEALVSRLKIMARLDISEKRLPQDGAARVRVGDREIDIRVSTAPVAEGERVVLRLLNRADVLLPISALGMNPNTLASLRRAMAEPNGMIVVAGPTGSGKTTTLYAALQTLDAAHTNIMTIEDPVEYRLPHIGQMQVKPGIGLTFASGLRHILRQDPDTILVGEIRDTETAEIAVRSALTGHLVFSTLHTNDAAESLIRLIDMGIEPFLLAASLRAVLAQRLTRKLCPACRAPRELAAGETLFPGISGPVRVWTASKTGCPQCRGGYAGRTGVFELLELTPEIAEAVRGGETSLAAIKAMARNAGMKTMAEDGVEKALQGVTSVEELARTIGRVNIR